LLIYSIILDIIIFIYLRLNSSRENSSSKLFSHFVFFTAVVAVIGTVAWFSGQTGNDALIPVNYWSNAVFLSLTGLPAAFGIKYLDYKIFGNLEKSRKRFWLYMIPTYINTGFAVYNIFDEGFLFYITDMNQYHRGIGVGIGTAAIYFCFIATVIYFYKYKQMITGRIVQSIMIFFFIPIIGSLLQVLAYGTTFGMPSYTLSIFIVLLILERDEMGRDELTNLYTRAKLESRLKFKIRAGDAFTVIMADLDDFKSINDTYGHSEGDRVLKKVADILRLSTNVEDMVCRYGGDEFLMLIECENDIGQAIIDRVNNSLAKYNHYNYNYKVNLSFGIVFVEEPEGITSEELLCSADKKMYENKANKKLKGATPKS